MLKSAHSLYTISSRFNIFHIIDSVLAFKKRMKLGQFAEKDPAAEDKAKAREEAEKREAEAIAVGSRCEVTLPEATAKRGTVMFVGELIAMFINVPVGNWTMNYCVLSISD